MGHRIRISKKPEEKKKIYIPQSNELPQDHPFSLSL